MAPTHSQSRLGKGTIQFSDETRQDIQVNDIIIARTSHLLSKSRPRGDSPCRDQFRPLRRGGTCRTLWGR
jgi:hypothetical protein